MGTFNFRIIKCANGIEIIDSTLSTPCSILTPTQMVEYINVENSLYFTNRQEKKTKESFLHKIKRNIRRRLA